MGQPVQIGGLSVATSPHRFVEHDAAPDSAVDPQAFWEGVDAISHDLAPRSRDLMARRDELQSRIDAWHREQRGTLDGAAHTSFRRPAMPTSSV